MAKGTFENPAAALGEASRFADLRARLFFLAGALIVYRIGTFIPVPGIDPVALEQFFQEQSGTILSMFNMFSGGALERLSIFALGIMPYISASIIMQMAGVVVPQIAQLKKEGEAGRRKITQYTRYGTVILASAQAMGAAVAFQNQGVVISPGPNFVFTAAVTLVTGTVFLMWLGEQITERGIGNGISMIILSSIIAGLPSAVGGTLELVNTGEMSPALALLLIILVIAVTYFVVFHGAWTASHHRQLRQAAARPQNVRRSDQSSAFQDQYVGCYPADFREQPYSFPGHDCYLVWQQRGFRLAAGSGCQAGPGAADIHNDLCLTDRVLLFLLHGLGI